jgi:hypothetical protein
MTHHDHTKETYEAEPNVWMRGLFMLIFAVFFGFAQTVLGVLALVQFLWMLFAKERNVALADFGESLGRWLARVAAFQTGATDEKPFPWAPWE